MSVDSEMARMAGQHEQEVSPKLTMEIVRDGEEGVEQERGDSSETCCWGIGIEGIEGIDGITIFLLPSLSRPCGLGAGQPGWVWWMAGVDPGISVAARL